MSTERFRVSPDGEYTYDVEWDRGNGRVRAMFGGEWIDCGTASDNEEVRLCASATLLRYEANELKTGAMAGSLCLSVLESMGPTRSWRMDRSSMVWEWICDRLPEPIARKQHFPHSCANAVLREFLRRDGRSLSDAQVASSAGRTDRIGWLNPDDLVQVLEGLGYTGTVVSGAQAASHLDAGRTVIAFHVVWSYLQMVQRGSGSIAHAVLMELSLDGVEVWDPSPLRRSRRGVSADTARQELRRSKAAIVIE